MKKMSVPMSMWETLAIPGKTNILKKALSDEANPKELWMN